MTDTLFHRLLQEQSTDKRKNLENYLTEILCDALNRIDSKVQEQLLDQLFNQDSVNQSVHTPLQWETQYPISWDGRTKFLDLVGFSDGIPWIVIESKIGAAFTAHQSSEENDGRREVLDQMTVYGRWMSGHNPDARLVLLTKTTQPPPGFLDENQPELFGVERRTCITWQNIYDSFKNLTSYPLASDFTSFLEQQGLGMDQPTRSDFAILELYLAGAGERISQMMQDSRRQLKIRFNDGVINWQAETKSISHGFQAIFNESVIWTWGVRARAPYAYIGWGFHFPNKIRENEWKWNLIFKGEMPSQPFAFVGIYADKGKDVRKIALSLLDDPWMTVGDPLVNAPFCAIAVRPLHDLLDDQNLNASFIEWVNGLFEEAVSVIK